MTTPHTPSVIGIAGWKNSGKTTLAVRLIAGLTARGYTVASIKHAHHDIDIDGGETDSARHRNAGATETAVVGPNRWAIVHEIRDAPEPNLADVLARLAPADIVIVEGYKSAAIPKIEVRRTQQADKTPLAPGVPSIIAIASDHETMGGGLPVFDLDDTASLVQFIIETILTPTAMNRGSAT